MSPKTAKKEAKAAKPAKAAKGAKEEKIDKSEMTESQLAALKEAEGDEEEDEDDSEGGGSSESMIPQLTNDAIPTGGNVSKNFRNHPDMENFYRFIYENDLRIEALQIIDNMLAVRGKSVSPTGEILSAKKK